MNKKLSQIARVVNAEMQITMRELKSKDREQNKVFARMLVAKLAYKHYNISQMEIAKFLKTEQPTISYYLKTIETDLNTNKSLFLRHNKIIIKLSKFGNRKLKTLQKKDYSLFPKLCLEAIGIEPVKELKFHPTRRWRFDFAFVNEKLAIEVEGGVWTGGRHTRGDGFLKDMEKYNEAARLGWRLLRTTPNQVETKQFISLIKNTLDKKNI
ncbi:helix-turn-helix domain-containing protein [Riemerella columbina]|uniref:helix-turn-helix domain-containing protein n=1 Tax=Riemerella columbina TaxID=103810 RepID=UPI0003827265|nr:helix-turn-helix domain-containing protein [Riemerella columbina]